MLTADLRRRLRPYQDLGLEVAPLTFRLPQLGQPGLEAILGAAEGTRVVQRLLEEAQARGADLTLAGLHRFVEGADDLSASQRRAAHVRLQAFEEFEAPPDDHEGLWRLFAPGRATVLYLGGPHMGRARVAPLVVGLMNGLLLPSPHGAFQRVIAVDEMNLLAEDALAWQAFTRTARLVRHRGATLVLLGQDLLCVPQELFGLAGLVGVMAQRSPALFDHVRERVGALRGHRYEEVARLRPGEMLLCAGTTTDPAGSRPRASSRSARSAACTAASPARRSERDLSRHTSGIFCPHVGCALRRLAPPTDGTGSSPLRPPRAPVVS